MMKIQNRFKRFVLSAFLTVIASLAVTSPSFAAEPKLIGTYGEWAAYEYNEDGNKVCYMASQPQAAKGDYTRRGDVFVLITHRPQEGTKNVFSYMTGYPYKPNSDATVKIDNNTFTLFTQEETAWAPDAETDNRLADSIRRGINMVVKGTSTRGTLTTDTFSLKGSAAAHDAISKACGIR